jgi:hypothetical protein
MGARTGRLGGQRAGLGQALDIRLRHARQRQHLAALRGQGLQLVAARAAFQQPALGDDALALEHAVAGDLALGEREPGQGFQVIALDGDQIGALQPREHLARRHLLAFGHQQRLDDAGLARRDHLQLRVRHGDSGGPAARQRALCRRHRRELDAEGALLLRRQRHRLGGPAGEARQPRQRGQQHDGELPGAAARTGSGARRNGSRCV